MSGAIKYRRFVFERWQLKNLENMTNKEIKKEADRLQLKAIEMKDFADTLEYDHQKDAKHDLLMKSKDFQETADKYYELLPKSALANER